MSTTLYEQAIVDAEDLKRMAEENARNQVIEAITPQIRALIESEMLQEDSETLMEEKNSSCPKCGGELTSEGNCMESSCNAADSCDKCGKTPCKCDDKNLLLDEEDESTRVDETELKALSLLVNSAIDVHTRDLAERAHSLRKNLAKFVIVKESFDLDELDQESRMEFLKRFNDLMREGIILRREAILMNEADSQQVQHLVEKTIKEMKVMSKSLNKTLLNRLFEAEGDEELALDVEDDVGGEELGMEMEDTDGVEVPEDLARDLLSALEAELGGGEEEMEMELEEPAAEEPGEELSMEMDMYEADEKEDLDEVFEIDVNELRKELRKLQEGDAADMADQFGGGEALGDVVFEIDEDDLINVLADELGREDVPTPKMESRRRSRKLSESRRPSRQQLQESRQNRALRSQLTEAKKAVSALQEQLSGMNLFNAKLLYANKLMQNKGLTTKQQHAIVEALDGAETLDEAKLLFKSLTAALTKKKSLSESKKLGSASKSTRPSGQSLNEGVGTTDRWAVLAGIKSQNQD
jgi:hypothetical protein